jgi:hypothetical protein
MGTPFASFNLLIRNTLSPSSIFRRSAISASAITNSSSRSLMRPTKPLFSPCEKKLSTYSRFSFCITSLTKFPLLGTDTSNPSLVREPIALRIVTRLTLHSLLSSLSDGIFSAGFKLPVFICVNKKSLTCICAGTAVSLSTFPTM